MATQTVVAEPSTAGTATASAPSTARCTRSMTRGDPFDTPTPLEPPIRRSTPVEGNNNWREEEEERLTDITEPYDEYRLSTFMDEDELEEEIKKEELAKKRHYLESLRQERRAREKDGKKKTQNKPSTSTQLYKQFKERCTGGYL